MAVPGHTYCSKHLAESQKRHQEWLESHKESKPFQNAIRTNNYNTWAWKKLRKEVLERDNNQCRQCGMTKEESGYPLEIHHIDPPKGNDDLFYNADNCVTLCKICHARITQIETMENNRYGTK